MGVFARRSIPGCFTASACAGSRFAYASTARAAQRSQSHRSERARRQPLQNSYSEGVLRDHERASVPEEFNKIYDLRSLIGVGTTAKVFLCLRRATGERLACKVIDKRRLNLEPGQQEEQLLTQLRREIDTLRSLQHPNIVKFEDVVETADMIYVVMELVSGGELFDWLLENGCMEEERAAHLMHGVVSCIAYMHSRGVVHRDLKAENLLLVDRAARWPQAKLIDFGFSTILRYNLTGSFLGTGGYIAPEIRQQRSYSQSVDMWACGVLIYLLNSRRLPFNSDVDVLPHGRHHAQMRYELKFPEVQWKGRSDSVKELLTHMLDVDPMTRWTAQQVLRHPWITGRAFTAAAAARRAPPQGAAEQPVARLLKEAPQRARRPRPHWHKDNWTPIIEDEADADAGAGRTPPQPRSPSHAQQLELQEQRMRSHSNEWVEPDVGTIWWRHHLRQGKRHHAYDPAVLHTTSAGDLLTTAKGSSRRRTRHLVPASNG
ncbi:kinase-like domain-containing protein [Tribonema minus]|uniref:Kinase-like domain-containing protein n=1 Tax=Tribonema minus TaxID=303371 RepID=A0A836CIF0_9STRA|nr:kinase-like domain-containing protein [Tribonema minus]